MPTYDKHDPLQLAAFAWEYGSAGTYIDPGSSGGGAAKHIPSRPYCPGCHGFDTLKKAAGDTVYVCSRCGQSTNKYVYMKPQGGVYASGTHVPKVREIGDWMTDIDITGIRNALKRMDPTVLLWFRYAHTSDFDEKTRHKAANKLFAAVYAEVCTGVTTSKLADSVKIFHLIGLMINGLAPGQKQPTFSDIAGMIGIDRSQFNSDRRWYRLNDQITRLIGRWERIVIDEITYNRITPERATAD